MYNVIILLIVVKCSRLEHSTLRGEMGVVGFSLYLYVLIWKLCLYSPLQRDEKRRTTWSDINILTWMQNSQDQYISRWASNGKRIAKDRRAPGTILWGQPEVIVPFKCDPGFVLAYSITYAVVARSTAGCIGTNIFCSSYREQPSIRYEPRAC